MTPSGRALATAGALCAATGLWWGWAAPALVGFGLLAALAAAAVFVVRSAPVRLERVVHPDRVPKGSPAIAMVTARHRGRIRSAPFAAVQPFGATSVVLPVPGLRPGSVHRRVHHLPTTQRGVHVLPPVQEHRRDPFGLVRRDRMHGAAQEIRVTPRILPMTGLGAGRSRLVEGPSSDTSPVGTVTFHRLREYEPGDDLRLVHWPTTARTGRVVVRHHVDTSQPLTVVVLDVRSAAYASPAHFEEAVDVAASAVAAATAGRCPVELWPGTTPATGLAQTSPALLLEALTDVRAHDQGPGLAEVLDRVAGRRSVSTLLVVSGSVDATTLARCAAWRTRAERVAVATLGAAPPAPRGVLLVEGVDASGVVASWNAAVRTGRRSRL